MYKENRDLGLVCEDQVFKEWGDIVKSAPDDIEFELPKGEMKELGYVLMQHSFTGSKQVKSYFFDSFEHFL